MNINKTARDMLDIITAVIKGKKINLSEMDIDWESMLKLCEYHGVTNLMAYAADSSVPKEYLAKFHQASMIATSRTAQFDFATEEIRNEFEKNKISYMLLKGHIMRGYYPSPEMRTMCDVDLLIKEEDDEKIQKIMAELGYTMKNEFGRDDEKSYYRPPHCSYDMHTQLVSDSHKKLKAYYGTGWRVAKKDTEYGYVMSNEDFFIFLLAHFTKHYANAGIGVRPILDIWIFLDKFNDTLDWDYINQELDKMQMKEFCYNIFRLSKVWFDGEASDETTDDMTRYILFSGMYGTTGNWYRAKKVQADNKLVHNVKGKLNAIFLNRRYMEQFYPKLKEKPYLLGYYWCKRIVVKLFDGSGAKYVKNQKKTNAERTNATEQHFNAVGLEDYLK